MHDITTISDEFIRGIGSVDVICGGFPCQAFSIAGKRKGFEDTRGTLFFEIARFAYILRPRYLFLENVKGLLNHEGGATFETILRALDELGYDAEWEVHNSKDYVPQNRERVFIIGHLRGGRTEQIFPFAGIDTTLNNQCIKKVGNIRKNGKSQSGDVFDKSGLSPTLCSTTTMKDAPKIITGQPNRIDGKRQVSYKLSDTVGTLLASQYKNGDTQPKVVIPVLTPDRAKKRQNGRRFKNDGEEIFTLTAQDRHGIMIAGKLPGNHDQNSRVYSEEGLAPTLSTMQGGGQEPKILIKEATAQGYAQALPGDSINISHPNSETRRGRVGKGIANTLLTGKEQAVVTDEFQIRKLTPRECWRLQGFPDWAFDRAKEVNSDSQLYKQAGNSVTVPVIHDIARRLVSYPTK